MTENTTTTDLTQDDDDGFHDHALSELYRAAEDLSPWYSAAELGQMILARARRVAEEKMDPTQFGLPAGTPDPFAA